jgi:hypothetical protein
MRARIIASVLISIQVGFAGATAEEICSHKVIRDHAGGILSWYMPATPGAGYVQVCKLASEFIKSGVPVDPVTGQRLYFISCCFDGPHLKGQEAFAAGRTWQDWPNNPACVFAGLVQGLALDWRVFAGDDAYLNLVRGMLDHQLEFGTTPPEWPWGNVPYASGDPGAIVWQGATKWEQDGMRGDGLHGIEPDKVGELGIAYLKFYEVTGDKKYLRAAIGCGDALAKHVRKEANTAKSPWPFRVNAGTGVVISEYCSNVIDPIRLFDELIRIQERIHLDKKKAVDYRDARDIAWKWFYGTTGPMKTYIWNAYFEDVPNDPDRANRNQITPLETARYLLKHLELDPKIDESVPALVHWVASAFGTEGMEAIKEQTWCYEPMGSHTARYASICALVYERTGDTRYKELAYRFFNFATYMTYENGVVAVGPSWPGSWFSDGYGDYIRHFMEGLGAVPEWAPAGEDHLLRSTSVVQHVSYSSDRIDYRTFDDSGTEVLRITSRPKSVKVNGEAIPQESSPAREGWTWQSLDQGGILRIRRAAGHEIEIRK